MPLDAVLCGCDGACMLRRSSFSSLLFSSLIAAGCVQGAPPPEEGPAGQTEQSIINGDPDTMHDAVIAVLGNQSACTGTIIHKDVANKRGYVLTAAHCVDDPPQVVVRGTNYVNGTQYPVVDYLAHSSYNGQVYDFAMVTFSWSQNEPPVIPAMTGAQDDLAAGSDVKFLGYGVTENSQNNSVRYYFNGELQQVQALTFSYNQSNSGSFANNGGPCFGDSGGPALFDLAGVGWVVAGVTSYGDQDCTQFGVSGRVSAIGTWITNYIANGGGGMSGQTCDQCTQETLSAGGTCASSWNSCLNNSQCSAFVDCLNGCQDDACVDGCVQDYPNGVDGYLAVIDCICDNGCANECGSEPFCQGGGGPQGCGFTAEDPQCLSCFEGNCCNQGAACAEDQGCSDCLTGANPDPNCINENVLAAQFYQCLAQKCGDECGIQGGGGSGAGGGGVGGSGSGAGGGGVGAGGGGVGPGGGGVGAGEVGGNGAGAGDEGGNSNGDGGGENNDDGNVSAVACTCRAAGGEAPNGNVAIALGAALAGLFASRRKRRVS